MIFSAPFLAEAQNGIEQFLGASFYFLLDPVCHQLPDRSIFLNQLPLPVCARCTFIYLGGLLVFTEAAFSRCFKSWPKKYFIFLAVFVLLEWSGERIGFYTNWLELRALSGLLLGILLFRLFAESLYVTEHKKGKRETDG